MSINRDMKLGIRKFDLFSKPFEFFVGENKANSTFFGGVLSLAILGISGAYFYYLLHLYFSNQIEPKITSSNVIETTFTSLLIQDSFFLFEYFIDGEPLSKYQKRVDKTFLDYSVYYEVYYSNGTYSRVPVTLVDCTDEIFIGYLCLNKEDVVNKNIFADISQQLTSDFSLEINYCNHKIHSNCATDEEIYDTIFTPTNSFIIHIQIRQYSPAEREYQSGYKQEYYYFDPSNVILSRFSLIKASTTVVEGFLIQSSTQTDGIYDFKRLDTIFSRNNIQQRLNFSGIGLLIFENNQVKNIIKVQHAMITEVLAQFMSIFNSLLIVGIICRMLAQTHIVEDINSILLKEYYKKTALRLISKTNDINSKFKTQSTKTLNPNASYKIVVLQKKIQGINFSEKLRKYFDLTFLDSLKMFFAKLAGKHRDIDSKQDKRDSIIYQQLLNQTVKKINILEVYKDLIKLKMAIKLILTKEQFAAIQFCGSELAQIEDQSKEILNPVILEEIKLQRRLKTPEVLSNQQLSPNILSPDKDVEIVISNPFGKQEQDENINDKKSQMIVSQELNNVSKQQVNRMAEYKMILKEDNNQIKLERIMLQKEHSQQSAKDMKDGMKIKVSQNFLPNIQGENNQDKDLVLFRDSEESYAKIEENRNIEQTNSIKGLLEINMKINNDGSDSGEEKGCNKSKRLSNMSYDSSKFTRSHLWEMDMIEEDQELQEQWLQKFLEGVQLQAKNEGNFNHLDRQIFESLIGNERQLNIPYRQGMKEKQPRKNIIQNKKNIYKDRQEQQNQECIIEIQEKTK